MKYKMISRDGHVVVLENGKPIARFLTDDKRDNKDKAVALAWKLNNPAKGSV